MAYTKIGFVPKSLITASQLNHLEDGIANAATETQSALNYALKGNKSSAIVNLADNSNFAAARFIKQAGLNGKHGNTKYIGDRWYGTTNCTGETHGLFITLKNTNEAGTTMSAYGRMCQKVYHNLKSKTVTVAARIKSNTFRFGLYYTVDGQEQQIQVSNATTMSTTQIFIATGTVPSNAEDFELRVYPYRSDTVIGSAELYWIALYEGSYTADTLPEYHAKNYVTELLECQRYYQKMYVQAQPCYIIQSGAAAYTGIRLPVPLYLDTSSSSTSSPTIYADYTIDAETEAAPVGVLRYDNNTSANIQANSLTFQSMQNNLLRLQFNWVKASSSADIVISSNSRVAMWNTGRFDLISPFDG